MPTISSTKTNQLPISAFEQFEKKREAAATMVQKHWRGFHVRRHFAHSKIDCEHCTGRRNPVGNDPISDMERHVTLKKHPAILATGGVQCLYNAIKLTEKGNGQLGEKPKIFVMDYDSQMLQYWKIIKRAFNESEDVESFLKKLPQLTRNINDPDEYMLYIPFFPKELTLKEKYSLWQLHGLTPAEVREKHFSKEFPSVDIKDYHPDSVHTFFLRLFGDNPERFYWVKSVVVNSLHLLENCWYHSHDAFRFIKRICEHHNYEMVVYASNIEDCNPCFSGTLLWNNIATLNPTKVAKTNTLWHKNGLGLPMSTDYIDFQSRVGKYN